MEPFDDYLEKIDIEFNRKIGWKLNVSWDWSPPIGGTSLVRESDYNALLFAYRSLEKSLELEKNMNLTGFLGKKQEVPIADRSPEEQEAAGIALLSALDSLSPFELHEKLRSQGYRGLLDR
jgi:hypothetical protein